MFEKVGIAASLMSLIFIGFLLAIGHPGIAIKVTNYLYFLLLASTFIMLTSLKK